MDKPIDILRTALKDPKLEDLPCICPAYNSELAKILEKLPADAFVSEWRCGHSEITYEYRVHRNGMGQSLRDAFEGGTRGGYPFLTAVYTIGELRKISQESEVFSAHPEERPQTHY